MAIISRVGQGYDVHPLQAGGELVLAGVRIADDMHLAGHSDADVVIHAVIDALLGAAGLGDIGEHFPDSDPAYKGIAGSKLLARVLELVRREGFTPVNVDTTIIMERPRLSPFKMAMRQTLAKMLGLEVGAVSIKAKTNEALGDIGAGRAVACQAIVTLAQVN